jgi:penicillin-binding protein 1C
MKHMHKIAMNFWRKIKKIWKKIKIPKKISKNTIMLAVSIVVFLMAVAIIWVSSLKIPDFTAFEDRKVANSTRIYDRTGEILLYTLSDDVKRTDIGFADMGINIKNATIAIEDASFYSHNGIKISSIIRAVIANILPGGRTQGGSTITQQLVKNTLLTSKRTPIRKIKEWILAIKIDRSMPKEKILEYYLNESPYGGSIYGIQEASQTYFGKNPIDLTLAESAYLAAIPQSPTRLSPYGKNKNLLDERKNLVLSRMRDLNFINKEEHDLARNEEVAFLPQTIGNIRAPHFVFFIKDYLEQKYGLDTAEKGGLKVTTTLDYELQEKGELIVKEGALANAKDWNGSNASLVAIDPKTGQILTMIGSRNYFDKEIDGNFNVATAKRQPGSSFKPFIYATAFNKGFTPNTVLFDVPTEFNSSCDPYGKPKSGNANCYSPNNYDGLFRGPLSLRAALAQSINIPAIKLFYLSGLEDSQKVSEDMGISTLTDVNRYGLTLVIGGGEVTLLDITSAYGVFANSGVRNPYTGILKIEDRSGRVLEEYIQDEKEVLPKNTALMISDILSDNQARIPTFGANSPLLVPGHDVAAKTGTTNNNKDAWTMGYSPSIVVGVWAGNNDNTPMRKGGSALAGPIWNKFMKVALEKLPSEDFEEPDLYFDPIKYKPVLRGLWQGNDSFVINTITGNLATEFTPEEVRREKVVTNVHTILYWVDRNDIMGGAPSNPSANSQFYNWETGVQNWWAQNRGSYPFVSGDEIPQESDGMDPNSEIPIVSIIEPDEITVYKQDEKINLKIENTSELPLRKIDVFINGIFVDSLKSPFKFSFVPSELENLKSNNILTLVSYDSEYNKGNASISFKVEN